nr:uncharacterized protein LOC107436224 isoform X2 [Parasteatoda tepidariorum]
MVAAPQTHFAPLSEALCKVVADLNGKADTNAIRVKLEENFPEMQSPSEEILQKSLNSLMRERKLHYTGGYYVADRQHHHPSFERQMLMTNEEAIVKLHGDASSLLTQTCSHLQMMDIRIGNNEEKREGEGKQESVLAKILKRMKSNKQTFSAQFPPPGTLLCHSVATQTQKIYSPLQEHKIPWEILRHGGDGFQNSAKGNIIPTYRHSLSSAFKRRHRQRTSSSESSKITKTPADKCESKMSSGSAPFKPPHKSKPEKRHKPPKQYSKAPLTKQVKKIQEVTSSNDNNIPTRNDIPTEDAEKNLSIKKNIPVDKQEDIVIDNTLCVETSKGNVSTTVVTEETTVTKGKVVTVTSITTSLTRNKSGEAKKNDLNQESANISELSNSCNIVK